MEQQDKEDPMKAEPDSTAREHTGFHTLDLHAQIPLRGPLIGFTVDEQCKTI